MLEYIKQMYEKNLDSSESDIRQHVVVNLLILLGYDKDEIKYEYPKYHRDGRVDLAVKVAENNYLFVEVKKSNTPLSNKEISQLSVYLTERNIEWGILTNGRRYILLNSKIRVDDEVGERRDIQQDKIVFDIDIFDRKREENIKFYSKEYLFDRSLTTYFKDIALFKAIKFPNQTKSWNVYKGTLYGFFKYYCELQGKYRNLNRIRVDEFEEYLKYDSELKNSKSMGKKIKSKDTPSNKYSHIRSFFKTLNIKDSEFLDESKNELLSRIEIENEKNSTNNEILNPELISNILKFYDTRRDATRNKVIFLLCLSFGLERSTLVNLSFDHIKGNKLIVADRELVIPTKVVELLTELKEINKRFKVKNNYLFISKHNGEYKKISEASINNIFDKIQEMDKNDLSLKQLNPACIRFQLINKLFNNGVAIEEIVYLTGIDLVNISNVISNEKIIEQVRLRKNTVYRNHPFEDILY